MNYFPLEYLNDEGSMLGEVEGSQFHGQNMQNSWNNSIDFDDEMWRSLGSFAPTLQEEKPQLHYSQTLSKELNHHVELANEPPVPPPLQKSASSLPVQRKRTLWTPEEHRKFLLAVRKHGKGKLVEITKDIGTKTYTQVASHAQKYFKRQDLPPEKKKRKSIHDMILEDTNEVVYEEVLQNSSVNPFLEHTNEIPYHNFQQNPTFDLKYTNELLHHNFQQNSTFNLKYNNEVPSAFVHQNLAHGPRSLYATDIYMGEATSTRNAAS